MRKEITYVAIDGAKFDSEKLCKEHESKFHTICLIVQKSNGKIDESIAVQLVTKHLIIAIPKELANPIDFLNDIEINTRSLTNVFMTPEQESKLTKFSNMRYITVDDPVKVLNDIFVVKYS